MDKYYNITFHGARMFADVGGKQIEQNYLPNIHFQCDPKEWCELIAAKHPKVTGFSYEEVEA